MSLKNSNDTIGNRTRDQTDPDPIVNLCALEKKMEPQNLGYWTRGVVIVLTALLQMWPWIDWEWNANISVIELVVYSLYQFPCYGCGPEFIV
jgi:hypothetical protein